MNLPYIRAHLPDRDIHHHESIPTTMSEAARLAGEGAPSGTAVIADEQTAGLGRYGRNWHSEPNSGLYVSIIIRHNLTPETLPVITLALGLAVSEAIQQTTNLACDLRWPNDVLITDKKCAGILTQIEGSAVIVGIGVNVNHTNFPAEIAAEATSLRIASGREQSREQLLVAMLPAIHSYCALLSEKGKQPILDMFSHASSYVSGRRVTVDQGDDNVLRGTTAGLNGSGFLMLQQDNGKRNLIVAGGVRPCS